MDIRHKKFDPSLCLSKSLKGIGTDTDLSGYLWLSISDPLYNHGSIVVSEVEDRNFFPTRIYFNAPTEGFPGIL